MKMRIIALFVAVSVLCLSHGPAHSMFRKPDLEKVPVERLVKNLEDLVQKDPKDVQLRFNLARVHAMAFAMKTDTVEMNKKKPEWGAWLGYTPSAVPFKVVKTEDKEKLEAAKKHLEKAIAAYKDVLKVQGDHLPAQLGLAWITEQSSDKGDAIKAYRKLIETSWKKDGEAKFGPLGGNFITAEAANYLIPLLDKGKDGDEIATLKERQAKLAKLPRPITPIAIPLKDGLSWRDIEDKNASVAFDVDGTGLPRCWTWITKDAGWLVHDPQKSGKITSGLQLFGNVTFWCFWDNGYQALRCLDDNRDGNISGKELNGLAIWHDANGDGICQPDEVRPLSHYGIDGLSCEYQTDPQHPDRIAFSPRGVLLRDGTTRPTFDLILRQR